MKRLAFILLLFCSALAFSQRRSTPADFTAHRGECPSTVDTDAIRKIAQTMKDAYNAGDSDTIGSLYAEDAYYLTQHYAKGIIEGRKNIRAYFKLGTDAGYKIDSIEILAMNCSGEMAYTITRYESTNAGQKAFGHNIVVMKKMSGQWLIVAHESAVPEATAIQKLE